MNNKTRHSQLYLGNISLF